jgi:hypothetical protein
MPNPLYCYKCYKCYKNFVTEKESILTSVGLKEVILTFNFFVTNVTRIYSLRENKNNSNWSNKLKRVTNVTTSKGAHFGLRWAKGAHFGLLFCYKQFVTFVTFVTNGGQKP